MRVFKFGGASVKNAEAVENVGRIITRFAANEKLVVVVSAMGKMTNALENVLHEYRDGNSDLPALQIVKDFHAEILDGLFPNNGIKAREEVNAIFISLENLILISILNQYQLL